MNWNFSSLGLIPDLVAQIPHGISTSQDNSPTPIGKTDRNSQFEATFWGVAGGLPVAGVPLSGLAYAFGAQSDPVASAVTYGVTGAALYYLAPRTAIALGDVMAYSVLRAMGFRMAGNTFQALFTSSEMQAGRIVPFWAWLLLGYGAWKIADTLHWYYVDPEVTDLDRDKRFREHNVPR